MTTPQQRRKAILDIISRKSFIGVSDLAARLDVTPATIRTDLQAMEDEGLVIRSHGGAIPVRKTVLDLHEDVKSKENVLKKKAIALRAAQKVESDDSIIIASGSTMMYFAEALAPVHHLNVVTPSVRIAMKLIDNPLVTVLQLGGIIYGNTLSTRGSYTEAGLDFFHCSKLFFGVEGFDVESGMTCATVEEANLTAKMIKSASQTIVLADSTKFGRKGFGRICAVDDVDAIITDDGISEEAVAQLEAAGVKVIIA